MDTQMNPCTSCVHLQGRKSIDDVSDKCYPCVWANSQTGFWPNYEAVDVISVRDWDAYSEDATNWQGYDEIKYMKQDNPLDIQVGGGHYKSMAIQPVEYITKNNLPYCEANVIKYISRWRDKGGKKDLEKAKHYIDLLIQLEGLE